MTPLGHFALRRLFFFPTAAPLRPWHFALLREQGRLRNKPKLFRVKIDEVTPTKLANKNSLGHFAVGNKFTG